MRKQNVMKETKTITPTNQDGKDNTNATTSTTKRIRYIPRKVRPNWTLRIASLRILARLIYLIRAIGDYGATNNYESYRSTSSYCTAAYNNAHRCSLFHELPTFPDGRHST